MPSSSLCRAVFTVPEAREECRSCEGRQRAGRQTILIVVEGGWVATGRRIAVVRQLPAAVLGLGAIVECTARSVQAGHEAFFALVLCVLALATTAPPAFLRPGGAAVTVTLACVLSFVPFHGLTVAGACAQAMVLYRLTRLGGQVSAIPLAAPFLPLALVGSSHVETRVLAIVLAAVAPAAAWAGAARRAHAAAREQAAAHEVIMGTLLEHTARGERARIAHELHDVVAHHISMIAVQAEMARLTTPGMPPGGAQRLSAIGDTARAALTEMRRLLGVLREDAAGPVELQPQPGLRQLNELLDAARDASGGGTRLILRGPPAALDPGVELAAYRIIQEALTNARRHAPGAAVDVELDYTEDTLRLRIRDNGPGPLTDPPVGGHGLLGMRERAAAVGGNLSTGPAVGGGFLVTATLPGKMGS